MKSRARPHSILHHFVNSFTPWAYDKNMQCGLSSEQASFWRENLDSRECRSGKNQSEVLVCDRKRAQRSSMKISVLTFLVKTITMKHSVASNF